ncbi:MULTISPECIES: cold shock and DUF1294 domain-containing protein [unclassified Diaminobutyricimonas]|uniref:cold shock and DUF1294 domain-containing protein n=1 Tax=unclassified Diaminobutyricimonas TaxID=2643261 RepID=UPI0012F4C933|nr:MULTISPECIES: cold shock and DUF1294 domain-containing protein [unclassified Diaminobutyricimonas]
MQSGTTRVEGTLASWNEDRGFGFITPADGGPRLFVHATGFESRAQRPEPGELLQFAIERDQDGKPRAIRVRRPTVARPSPSRRPESAEYRGRRGKLNLVALMSVIAFLVLYATVHLLWPVPWWVAAVYVGTSLLSVAIYGLDKSAATAGRWRISESTLLSIGVIGGWPGAVLAQQFLRHKTKKASFRRAFWATVILNVVAFAFATTPLRELIVARVVGS